MPARNVMTDSRAGKSLGSLVAKTLATSWRPSPLRPDFSEEELATVVPLLLGSGAGALGWWRVRDFGLQSSEAASELQQAYRLHTLHAALHEREIERAINLFRAAGAEPLLVKGWAVARLYPSKGLRPYGDIDLCFLPGQYPVALDVGASQQAAELNLDLHMGFNTLDSISPEELFSRSELVTLGETSVRVLAAEDHLRVLCIHLLRHGAWRPLWLCDIAMALESRGASFDWELCLGKDRRRADWVACAIGLSHQLLGAEINDTPVAARARRLPGWLISTVLKNWNAPFPQLYPPMSYVPSMKTYLRHPAGVLQALRKRWPDPTESTVRLKGPFNGLPRMPFQLIYLLSRAAKFFVSLPKSLRQPQ